MTETKKPENHAKFNILRFRISLRLNDILFPIDIRELTKALAEAGYIISQPQLPGVGARVRVTFGGELARKENVLIDGESERGVLGVVSKSPEDAFAAFNELISILSENFEINVDKRSRFFEILAEIKCAPKKAPVESLGNTFGANQTLKNIGNILGQNVSLFGFRIVPEGKVPNQEEWMDITIEPDILRPSSVMNISVIFRSKRRDVVEKFGVELENRLSKIIDTIENPVLT